MLRNDASSMQLYLDTIQYYPAVSAAEHPCTISGSAADIALGSTAVNSLNTTGMYQQGSYRNFPSFLPQPSSPRTEANRLTCTFLSTPSSPRTEANRLTCTFLSTPSSPRTEANRPTFLPTPSSPQTKANCFRVVLSSRQPLNNPKELFIQPVGRAV